MTLSTTPIVTEIKILLDTYRSISFKIRCYSEAQINCETLLHQLARVRSDIFQLKKEWLLAHMD